MGHRGEGTGAATPRRSLSGGKLLAVAAAAASIVAATLPSMAAGAVSCTLNAAQVDITLSAAGDSATLRQLPGGGELRVDDGDIEFACLDGAMVAADGSNTDLIKIDDAAVETTVNLDLDGGGFAPGVDNEPGDSDEIEIELNYGGEGDTLRVFGTPAADTWAVGAEGINTNVGADGAGAYDVDITYPGGESGFSERQITPEGGDDAVHGEGGFGPTESAVGARYFGDIGNDTLIGGSGGDSLNGGGGDDLVRGRGGTDTFLPDVGADEIDGVTEAGVSSDILNFGLAPPGVVFDLSLVPGEQNTGSTGTDMINGTFPVVFGSPNADVLKGSATSGVTIFGQFGDDLIEGGSGNESLRGNAGADTVRGGLGNDTMFAGSFDVDTPHPADTVAFDGVAGPAGVNVNLAANTASGEGDDTVYGFPNVIGSDFADSISGDGQANTLTGGAGIDTVLGLAGADTLQLRDGLGDTGDCGADGDTAVVDAGGLDTLIGCEAVDDGTVAAVPPPPPAPLLPDCTALRVKLKKAKKRLKAAKRADKPIAKKRKKVRKLKRQLRALGC